MDLWQLPRTNSRVIIIEGMRADYNNAFQPHGFAFMKNLEKTFGSFVFCSPWCLYSSAFTYLPCAFRHKILIITFTNKTWFKSKPLHFGKIVTFYRDWNSKLRTWEFRGMSLLLPPEGQKFYVEEFFLKEAGNCVDIETSVCSKILTIGK